MTAPIIGIAGTNGAGKDTIGELLAAHHNFLFVSVSELLRNELRRRGSPVDRDHLRDLSAEWRREYGYSVLIDRAVDAFEMTRGEFSGLAIASLRNPFEADRVHELGGEVWWIDADQKLRFERIRQNAASRSRADEDEKTFEQFQAEEAAEMHRSGDEATLDMAAVRDKADRNLQNGGNELSQLQSEIAGLINAI